LECAADAPVRYDSPPLTPHEVAERRVWPLPPDPLDFRPPTAVGEFPDSLRHITLIASFGPSFPLVFKSAPSQKTRVLPVRLRGQDPLSPPHLLVVHGCRAILRTPHNCSRYSLPHFPPPSLLNWLTGGCFPSCMRL